MPRSFVLICLFLVLTGSFVGSMMAVLPGLAQNSSQAEKVDLNSATQQQLEALPGIGPRTAERIIQFREENGPFRRIEDLMNVPGIGKKKFERLKELIRVGPAADSGS
ncbi:MAG TPA: ComEA family DNA-binding protein [Acidobacteriota bacterium]|nr:ComEA family DNA-binding protein [Acidobacteriota bacterium]